MSKFKRSTNGFGSWGAYQVKFKKDDKGRVIKIGCLPILEDGTADDVHVVVIPPANIPENLFEGRHVLQLSEDKKSIQAFKPYAGQHEARFLKFSGKEGEVPTPKIKSGEYGDYQVFYPVYEITSGAYKGCNASQELMYKFQPGDDGLTEFKGTKGARLEQLEEFLDTVIGSFDPPKWPDSGNLLPIFDKMANRSKRKIGLVFKKGWIVTLVELDGNSSTGGSNPPWKQEPDKE